jgi:aminoacylase
MKSVGIQHLEAVRRLKAEGKRLKRTIHLCFIADEELGGLEGMKRLVVSEDFRRLNVGFALDEGLASTDDVVPVYYGERCGFKTWFNCTGNPGHGSQFIKDTAGEKIRYIIDKMMDFREEQKHLLESNPGLGLADVTTTNLTMLEGGVQHNVVPERLRVGFDIRVTPSTDLETFEAQLRRWAREAGDGVEVSFFNKWTDKTLTSVCADDPWFSAFKRATDKHALRIDTRIFPAATDSRYLRQAGIPSLGFSPMNNTPVLLHDHNEFLNEKIFLKGIDIFYDIIGHIAEV